MQMRLPPVVHPSFGQMASIMGIIWGTGCPTLTGTEHKNEQVTEHSTHYMHLPSPFHSSRCGQRSHMNYRWSTEWSSSQLTFCNWTLKEAKWQPLPSDTETNQRGCLWVKTHSCYRMLPWWFELPGRLESDFFPCLELLWTNMHSDSDRGGSVTAGLLYTASYVHWAEENLWVITTFRNTVIIIKWQAWDGWTHIARVLQLNADVWLA